MHYRFILFNVLTRARFQEPLLEEYSVAAHVGF